MNKLYVAGIAFLLSFTGCIEDPDLEQSKIQLNANWFLTGIVQARILVDKIYLK